MWSRGHPASSFLRRHRFTILARRAKAIFTLVRHHSGNSLYQSPHQWVRPATCSRWVFMEKMSAAFQLKFVEANDEVQMLHSLLFSELRLARDPFSCGSYLGSTARNVHGTSHKPPRLFFLNISSRFSPIRGFVEVPCLSGQLACRQISFGTHAMLAQCCLARIPRKRTDCTCRHLVMISKACP